MTDQPDLLARARAWAADDPDDVTRAEVEAAHVGGPFVTEQFYRPAL